MKMDFLKAQYHAIDFIRVVRDDPSSSVESLTKIMEEHAIQVGKIAEEMEEMTRREAQLTEFVNMHRRHPMNEVELVDSTAMTICFSLLFVIVISIAFCRCKRMILGRPRKR